MLFNNYAPLNVCMLSINISMLLDLNINLGYLLDILLTSKLLGIHYSSSFFLALLLFNYSDPLIIVALLFIPI